MHTVDGNLTYEVPCNANNGGQWPNSAPNGGACSKQPDADWNQCGEYGATIPSHMFDARSVCTDATDSSTCDTSTFQQGYGMAADLVIYVTGTPQWDNENNCDGVMGFAAYCKSNARDRPIAGYINLCKKTIDETDVLTWEEVISLIVHETFHVLGFSSDGFDHFKNDDGTDRTDVFIAKQVRGKTRAIITLPTVVQKAKEFFDCDVMDGIELEDYSADSPGRPTSHWDNRIITYDFMISYVPPAAPYGIFTLAVLADSGWYNINFDYAQEPPYGRGKGCTWYLDKCIINGESIDNTVFCADNVEYSCAASYVGKYYCSTATWTTNLPSNMQYFSDAAKGGDNTYPDFCPLYEQYSNGDCRLWGKNNIGTADDSTADLGGFISGTSKCGLIYGDLNGFGASCFPTLCLKNYVGEYVGTRRSVYRNYKLSTFDAITCWQEDDGKIKEFPFEYAAATNYGFDKIYCPITNDVCYDSNPWICNGHGTVKDDGTCVCSPGYFGIDCTIENNAENRAKYGESDSLSKFVANVCNGGVWNYDKNDENVGILRVEIRSVRNTDYVEALFQSAIKNWIAVLTDINECDVDLRSYNRTIENFMVTADVYYYTTEKNWNDVTDADKSEVFDKLFNLEMSIKAIQQKEASGVHEDNISAAEMYNVLFCVAFSIYVCFH